MSREYRYMKMYEKEIVELNKQGLWTIKWENWRKIRLYQSTNKRIS